MADNVSITAGTGTAVHADEYTHSTLGSGKTQLVKLVDGTLDSSTAIAAGGGVEAGALRVTIASDSTGVLSVDDNGGAITVDGTVTANAGTDLNTSALALEAGGNLAAIKAKTDNIPALGQALAAASVPVILPSATITTLTPPAAITGFATSAKQDTIIGHVDGLEALAGTIDADTSNISTKIDTIAGAVLGTEVQVDVLTMPTVAVTQSGTWDEVGINDSGNSITVDGTVAVTGVATEAKQDTQVTHLATIAGDTTAIETAVQLIDDTVFVDDTATHATGTTKVIGIGAVAVPTDTSLSANDIGMPAMTTDRKLHVAVMDALPAGTAAIGKLSANSGVDIGDVDITSIAAGDNNIGNVDIASIAAGDNNIGNVDIVTMPVVSATIGDGTNVPEISTAGSDGSTNTKKGMAVYSRTQVYNGSTWDRLSGDTTGVNVKAIVGALPAGTKALGKLLPPDIDVTAHTNYARKYYTNAGAVTDGIIWSPAAGKRWHVVTMYLQTSAAATITLEDDKSGGDDPVWKGEIAANSGVVLSFTEKYPMASGEDAADLIITTTAGNVYVTAVGYEV